LIGLQSQPMKRGHAEALMPMIARVMKDAALAFTALDRIAVTTGPGSFTGLRVGLSAARGIALAAGKPVIGVTTLTAFAAPVVSANAAQAVISAIDARHDHVYVQAVAGDGSPLLSPRVAPIEEALEAARFGAAHLVGNAASILAEAAFPPAFRATTISARKFSSMVRSPARSNGPRATITSALDSGRGSRGGSTSRTR